MPNLENSVMECWLSIRYRDFYDIPRAFLVERGDDLLFFDCPFSQEPDDYGDDYTIYRVRRESHDRIDSISWADLARHSERVGVVPTKAVKFDATLRQAINADVFGLIEPETRGVMLRHHSPTERSMLTFGSGAFRQATATLDLRGDELAWRPRIRHSERTDPGQCEHQNCETT